MMCGLLPAPSAQLPAIRHPVAVIAHRGGPALGPENTLELYRKAILLGVDYVEIDVRETRDRQLVIMHDSTVDRATDGRGPVSELTLAEWRGLRIRSASGRPGAPPPTLDEALRLFRGKVNVYLDHKSGPVAPVLAALRKHGMMRSVIVYAGGDRLLEWKRAAPEIPVMPSLPDEYRGAGGVARFVREYPCEALDGHVTEWTKELVDQAHIAGLKVYVDCLGPSDNAAAFRNAIAIGVDGIQTDRPHDLLRVFQEMPTRRPGGRMRERPYNPGGQE